MKSVKSVILLFLPLIFLAAILTLFAVLGVVVWCASGRKRFFTYFTYFTYSAHCLLASSPAALNRSLTESSARP